MHKVVVKAGTLNTARTLHANRRRANDNGIDVPVAAGARVYGAFTPVVRASPETGVPTVVRVAHNGGLPASNTNRSGAFNMGWIAIGLRYLAQLWAAFSRERAVARAASKLASMSDRQLRDIGIQRSDIDLAVRFGRSNRRPGTPAGAGVEAER